MKDWEKEIKRIRLTAEKRAWLRKIFTEREHISELRKQTKYKGMGSREIM